MKERKEVIDLASPINTLDENIISLILSSKNNEGKPILYPSDWLAFSLTQKKYYHHFIQNETRPFFDLCNFKTYKDKVLNHFSKKKKVFEKDNKLIRENEREPLIMSQIIAGTAMGFILAASRSEPTFTFLFAPVFILIIMAITSTALHLAKPSLTQEQLKEIYQSFEKEYVLNQTSQNTYSPYIHEKKTHYQPKLSKKVNLACNMKKINT